MSEYAISIIGSKSYIWDEIVREHQRYVFKGITFTKIRRNCYVVVIPADKIKSKKKVST